MGIEVKNGWWVEERSEEEGGVFPLYLRCRIGTTVTEAGRTRLD